ncbi:MAG: MarP family serine protease [Nitriliruptoraceae bacterium]
MNLVDVALVVLIVGSIIRGFNVGFVARFLGWIGVVLGLVAATVTVPFVLGHLTSDDHGVRLFVGLATTGMTVAVSAFILGAIGGIVRSTVTASPLAALDRVIGAVASLVVTVTVVWLFIPAAADVPGAVSQQVRTSRIVATIDSATPDPPNTVRALQRLVDTSRFPEVFSSLAPTPPVDPAPEIVALDDESLAEVVAASAHVRASGCRAGGYDGSSFVVDDGLMMTNAHVVAGSSEIRVTFPDGTRHEATVVIFDPNRDLAVLAVENVTVRPLPIATDPASDEGAVVGYPGGQRAPRVAAARFERDISAAGRDIYGESATTRQVRVLSAKLERGDSGSPVVDDDGSVVGTVFAISPDQPDVVYAVHPDEMRQVLTAQHRPGETGRCM